MTEINKKSVRLWSIISGASLLIMALAAGIAYGFIFNSIYTEGNPSLTISAIENNSELYNTGLLLWCIILITDLLVSYGFYKFLNTIRRSLALVSGFLRLAYSIVFAVAILFLFMKSPDRFMNIWSVGLFIFGFHLIVTGIVVLNSSNFLKLIGVLLIIAGTGYSLINGILIFIPQATDLADTLETILVAPMTIGELSFGIWLLVRGGKSLNPQVSDLHIQGAV